MHAVSGTSQCGYALVVHQNDGDKGYKVPSLPLGQHHEGFFQSGSVGGYEVEVNAEEIYGVTPVALKDLSSSLATCFSLMF